MLSARVARLLALAVQSYPLHQQAGLVPVAVAAIIVTAAISMFPSCARPADISIFILDTNSDVVQGNSLAVAMPWLF